MKYLSLSIPGTTETPMQAGSGLVPTGGLETTGRSVISVFIILIVTIAILFALWSTIKGGWDMTTSRGVKEKFQRGRDEVFYALFGLAMVFLAFLLINVASAFFGVDLLPYLFK